MWLSFQQLLKSAIAFAMVVLIGAITVVSPARAADRGALLMRLQLRSTSPESGIYAAEAASYNVAVTDTVIEDLQAMSEHVALGLQSNSSAIRDISNKWNDELEGFLDGAQQKRSRLVTERLAALRSTSPESGIE
ncbi:MAG: hypothetical protein AAGA40_15510 [Cyanobacteria bacterium P01_E01_bin.45]